MFNFISLEKRTNLKRLGIFFPLYIALMFTIFFLSFLIFFVFRFDLSFIGLDNNRELKSEIFITYLEGDEIFYRQKGKNKKNLSYGDEIKKNVSIETGNDSYASIFIKGQGFYYLYPNTSLYFEELENFLLKKYEKKSQIILERGVK